jgi:hypothetical protein
VFKQVRCRGPAGQGGGDLDEFAPEQGLTDEGLVVLIDRGPVRGGVIGAVAKEKIDEIE